MDSGYMLRSLNKEVENMTLSGRKQGIHFYIYIKNFEQIVETEEEYSNTVNHSIHALDTYFSSIERYGKKHFGSVLTVEKITGARLHLYVTGDICSAYKCVENIASYAYQLSKMVNKEIPKYKSLIDFQIQIGACFGCFYEFNFLKKDSVGSQDYEELTTIGYAANFAAKLQGLAGVSKICISEDIYEKCIVNGDVYFKCTDDSIKKYEQDCFYEANLMSISKENLVSDDELYIVKEYANKVNLTEMSFTGARQDISFDELSKSNCKKVPGIVLFADVRGFTSKFKEDDSNLKQMAIETEQLLTAMYDVTMQNQGAHVQFQGDREEVLFQGSKGNNCCENAIRTGMRMIDITKKLNVHIGIGADYGMIYAARIGARGEKDNILIGSTVISADRLEDEEARKDQIAISDVVYMELVKMNSSLAQFFTKNTRDTYIATIGYQEYLSEMTSNQHKNATTAKNYNRAWRA